jgi:hypothetical protein
LIEQRAARKLFFFLFQTNPDLILRWLAGLRRVAWPLPHGAPGELEVEGWRDRSAGREVSLG